MSRIGVYGTPSDSAAPPQHQLGPVGRGEAEVVKAGRQLGERTAGGVRMGQQGDGETGSGMNRDAAVADVEGAPKTEDVDVEALADVEVGDGEREWLTPAKFGMAPHCPPVRRVGQGLPGRDGGSDGVAQVGQGLPQEHAVAALHLGLHTGVEAWSGSAR